MFCNYCGSPNDDTQTVCQQCGRTMIPVTSPSATDSPMPFVPRAMPNVEPTPPPTPGLPPEQAPSAMPPERTSGLAIASLVCSILCIPINIAGIICGHLALSEIKKGAGRVGGRGLAIAGLIIGYLQFALIPFILIIAAIAIPNLLRSRMAANEASAVGSLRTIMTAETAWQQENPTRGFTCSLAQLGPKNGPGAPSDAAEFIDSTLASGTRSGYRFSLRGCEADLPNEPVKRFIIIAEPVNRGQTGQRAFCSDETGVIRMAKDGLGSTCLESGTELQ